MKYKITTQILTPLHIGSGTELLAKFDYLADKEYTYILDQDVIYADELEKNGPEKARLDVPAGELITMPSHNRLSHFVRYTLKGTPGDVARLNEQIKDIDGNPYLPGSSLKGAIRQAIMVWAIGKGAVKPHHRRHPLKSGARNAADNWNNLSFGKDPHHDLLRLLQVADSRPSTDAALRFCPVRVFQHEAAPGSPVGVEAVDANANTVFESEIKIDELTLRHVEFDKKENEYYEAAELLSWANTQISWLMILPQILHQVSLFRLEEELKNARAWGWDLSANKYTELLEIAKNLPENAALVQVGWGGGWYSKSVGLVLDKDYIDSLRIKHELGKPPKALDDWEPDLNKPFPNSRRMLAHEGVEQKAQPAEPLGWVLVSFEALGEPRYPEYWKKLERIGQGLLAREWKVLKYDGPPIERRDVAQKQEAKDDIPEVPEEASEKAQDIRSKLEEIWAKRDKEGKK